MIYADVPIGGTQEAVRQLEEILGVKLTVSNHGYGHEGDGDEDGSYLAKFKL